MLWCCCWSKPPIEPKEYFRPFVRENKLDKKADLEEKDYEKWKEEERMKEELRRKKILNDHATTIQRVYRGRLHRRLAAEMWKIAMYECYFLSSICQLISAGNMPSNIGSTIGICDG